MPRERIRITGGAEVKKLKRGGWAARYRIPAHGDEPESRSPWRKIPDATGKKDAKRKAEAYKKELEDQINDYSTKPNITLGEYARKWHDDRLESGEIQHQTWIREESSIAAIEESELAKVPIGDINEEDIDLFKAAGQKTGWSKDKQRKVLAKLKQILKYAESRRIIPYNPSKVVQGINPEVTERRCLEKPDQLKVLIALDTRDKDGRKAAVRIAISCGFRMGECLGLQWQDVHLEESDAYISLRRQLNRDGELVYPKYNGIGDIPIDDDTAQWLWEWKNVVERESGKSDAEITTMPVCCNTKWGYLTHSNFSKWWRKFCVDNGLGTFGKIYYTRDKSGKRQKHYTEFSGYMFHELRHTVASELLGAGADLRTTQAIMRHKSVRSTEVYLHSIEANMVDAMAKLGESRGYMGKIDLEDMPDEYKRPKGLGKVEERPAHPRVGQRIRDAGARALRKHESRHRNDEQGFAESENQYE